MVGKADTEIGIGTMIGQGLIGSKARHHSRPIMDLLIGEAMDMEMEEMDFRGNPPRPIKAHHHSSPIMDLLIEEDMGPVTEEMDFKGNPTRAIKVHHHNNPIMDLLIEEDMAPETEEMDFKGTPTRAIKVHHHHNPIMDLLKGEDMGLEKREMGDFLKALLREVTICHRDKVMGKVITKDLLHLDKISPDLQKAKETGQAQIRYIICFKIDLCIS